MFLDLINSKICETGLVKKVVHFPRAKKKIFVARTRCENDNGWPRPQKVAPLVGFGETAKDLFLPLFTEKKLIKHSSLHSATSIFSMV